MIPQHIKDAVRAKLLADLEQYYKEAEEHEDEELLKCSPTSRVQDFFRYEAIAYGVMHPEHDADKDAEEHRQPDTPLIVDSEVWAWVSREPIGDGKWSLSIQVTKTNGEVVDPRPIIDVEVVSPAQPQIQHLDFS